MQVLFTAVCKREQNLERQTGMVVAYSPPSFQVVIFLVHFLRKKGKLISSLYFLCSKEDAWQGKKLYKNARTTGGEVETPVQHWHL